MIATILGVFLSVVQNAEHRWYETPARGAMGIGAGIESVVQLNGHNIATRHVVLHFEARRTRIEVRRAYGVRIDGRLPAPNPELTRETVLEIGPWVARLEPHPPTGIDPIDETFLGLADADERSVYADSLEDRGRVTEAALVRSQVIDAALAVQTPPAWRRRFLPIAIENCAVATCPRAYRHSCEVCERDIPIFGVIGDARDHALKRNPVAVDPAVWRCESDLRTPFVRRPRIEMGQPTRR